jgi:hypothetical protein
MMELKQALKCGDYRAKQEILLVMDADRFTVEDMALLLRWIASKPSIKHCVMMGATDMFPLHCDGQAFADVINWVDYGLLNGSPLFNHVEFNRDFTQLFESAMRYGSTLYIANRYNGIEQCLAEQLDGKAKRRVTNVYHVVKKKQQRAGHCEHLNALDEHLTPHFRAKHRITTSVLTMVDLSLLQMTRGYETEYYIFVVSLVQLKQMDRNALNHLFLEVPSLTVVFTEGFNPKKEKPFKMLRQALPQQTHPNTRHTLPYAQQALKPKQQPTTPLLL